MITKQTKKVIKQLYANSNKINLKLLKINNKKTFNITEKKYAIKNIINKILNIENEIDKAENPITLNKIISFFKSNSIFFNVTLNTINNVIKIKQTLKNKILYKFNFLVKSSVLIVPSK